MELVWTAPEARAARSTTARFCAAHGLADRVELGRRSAEDPAWFWDAAVRFLGLPFSAPYTKVLDESRGMAWTTWFPDGELNLAEACLDRWLPTQSGAVAVVAESEAGRTASFTYGELAAQVSLAAGALAGEGVGKGDPVGAFLPMGLEAVTLMLACARLGAIYVPIFSGFNAAAVTARLNDCSAGVLVTANGFRRRGSPVAMKATADEACALAPSVRRVLVAEHEPGLDAPFDPARDRWWREALAASEPLRRGPRTAAEDPLLLGYTSGTTGRPKGVVHVHAGWTVKVCAEGAFQFDLGPGERIGWVTDMGWIMGPWLVTAGLGNGASIVVYDGAPDWPDPGRLWRLAAAHRLSVLGLSPTLVRALRAAGDEHALGHDLSALHTFGSTGEPWNEEPWRWLFEVVGGASRPIVNMSGGTEVGACFLASDVLQGLKPTSVGMPCPGMAMAVYRPDGTPAGPGEVGELVCTRPWPGMARGIWGDPARFEETYFSRWPGVWVHGDWASVDADGFWFLHGRSDDTLNIAGKRIGPAEIESAAVGAPGVAMAAAVAAPDERKGDALVLYVVPSPSAGPADEVCTAAEEAVVGAFGKAFRPRAVVAVADLPRTRSQKIVRRAVRARAIGADPGDLSSLENPEALELIEPL
ncbi:MAG: AMP-binding protein [Acidimicrobiales bacterium]